MLELFSISDLRRLAFEEPFCNSLNQVVAVRLLQVVLDKIVVTNELVDRGLCHSKAVEMHISMHILPSDIVTLVR